MQTKLITAVQAADGQYKIAPDELLQAAEYLHRGQLVVFPTETVYGIGALVDQPAALREIFTVKGRPQDNPLILHVDSYAMLQRYVQPLNAEEKLLVDNFMPGPVTFILRRNQQVNDIITAGLDTVGIRMPGNVIARSLITACGAGIAAPSANISGKPSPTESKAVIDDFWQKVACIIDGGDSAFGVESTILDLSRKPYHILRPGAVSAAQFNAILQANGYAAEVVEQHDYYLPNLKAADVPKAPGMKYRHYAPEAEVKILRGSPAEMAKNLIKLVSGKKATAATAKIAVFVSRDLYAALPGAVQKQIDFPYFFEDYACNLKQLPHEELVESGFSSLDKKAFQAANGLFQALRQADRDQAALILVEAVENMGIAQAYMNRLTKAETK